MVQIRTAAAADAEATARCQIACWRETYGPLVDPEPRFAEPEIRMVRRSWVRGAR